MGALPSRNPITITGANATATKAPSGRSIAAAVTAKVNESAADHPGRSLNQAADHMASATQ
jgi:hypothetical protein